MNKPEDFVFNNGKKLLFNCTKKHNQRKVNDTVTRERQQ